MFFKQKTGQLTLIIPFENALVKKKQATTKASHPFFKQVVPHKNQTN